MLAKHEDRELDDRLVKAFEAEYARAKAQRERHELLGRFAAVNRRLTLHPVRTRVLQAMRAGADLSFAEIASLVERQGKALRPIRLVVARRLSAGPPATGPFLTPGEVAKELGVSARTVTNWCKKGMLAYVELESGHRRIPESALAAYRESKVHWAALDTAASRARGDAPEPDDADVFAELARRDATAS